MPGLKENLIAAIRATGPISVAEYMNRCLLDPEHGYYTTSDPFGTSGDFITAPEVSQMFGELLGLCLAQTWLDQEKPEKFVLAELGPGRGTLMADLLRATASVPGFQAAAHIHLVEASERLRAIQMEALSEYKITWCDTVFDLPPGPLFLIANEFFDALPIRQFVRAEGGWCERMIGATGDDLMFGLSPALPIAGLEHRLGDTSLGDIVETCAPALSIATEIGQRVSSSGGAAIAIDYGGWHSRGDTFQALRNHEFSDPLLSPGNADLTAHVDFEALAKAFSPAQTSKMVGQGILLGRLGIEQRATTLAKSMPEAQLDAHEAGFHRLTSADEMGNLFKAIAAYPAQAPCPAGFEP